MTKLRAPLTFENALAKVAGHIGWPEVARICGRQERAVRNWSEPDTTAGIPLEAALKLDVAFHAAGGEGAPFLLCYATRIDAESFTACRGREELIAAVAKLGKESGEAVAATLTAAHPNAGPRDFALAERELEETIAALHNSLSALRARRRAVEEGEEEEDAGGAPASPARAGEGVE